MGRKEGDRKKEGGKTGRHTERILLSHKRDGILFVTIYECKQDITTRELNQVEKDITV